MTREEMLQDLAYARSLAEEGRQTPLIGGAYLVLFGLLLAVCYLIEWAAITRLIQFNAIGLLWLGFGIASFAGVMMLRARTQSLPGGTSIGNRADRVIWQGVMWAILAVVAGTVLRGFLRNDWMAPNAIMAAGFGLYGVALYATAGLSGMSWLRMFGALSWLISAGLWFFMDEAWSYLLAAGASIVVLLIPGIVLMRREPRTTV